MEENKNKKFLVSTIIGVLSMVIVVVGATYAYFTVGVQNNFTETKVSSKFEKVGTVSLLPETTEMTLNLTIDDMLLKDDYVEYYGTKDGATTIQSSEVIAKASVSGEGIFNCTYQITMSATGENNMYDAVQSMDYPIDNVILWVDGVEYDFATENLFPKTVSGKINGLTEGISHDIVAQLKIINSRGTNQDVLKGTDIDITFNINNFSCKTVEMGDNAKYIYATSPENISTELIDGLYRYQGTYEEVTNNYICWRASDIDTCLRNNGANLYRIIGITPDGQLKIIKNSVESIAWQTSFGSDLSSYPSSRLKSNAESKTSWVFNENSKWKYGEITLSQFSSLTSINDVLNAEKNLNNTTLGKAGVMNFSDFFNHDTCYTDKTLDYVSECTNGWLLLKNINEEYSSLREWTYARININGVKNAFTISGTGGISTEKIENSLNYRPVLYVPAETYLQLKTGAGTITDPYIFKA